MTLLEYRRKYLFSLALCLVLCEMSVTSTTVRTRISVIVCIELLQQNLETTAY